MLPADPSVWLPALSPAVHLSSVGFFIFIYFCWAACSPISSVHPFFCVYLLFSRIILRLLTSMILIFFYVIILTEQPFVSISLYLLFSYVGLCVFNCLNFTLYFSILYLQSHHPLFFFTALCIHQFVAGTASPWSLLGCSSFCSERFQCSNCYINNIHSLCLISVFHAFYSFSYKLGHQ